MLPSQLRHVIRTHHFPPKFSHKIAIMRSTDPRMARWIMTGLCFSPFSSALQQPTTTNDDPHYNNQQLMMTGLCFSPFSSALQQPTTTNDDRSLFLPSSISTVNHRLRRTFIFHYSTDGVTNYITVRQKMKYMTELAGGEIALLTNSPY